MQKINLVDIISQKSWDKGHKFYATNVGEVELEKYERDSITVHVPNYGFVDFDEYGDLKQYEISKFWYPGTTLIPSGNEKTWDKYVTLIPGTNIQYRNFVGHYIEYLGNYMFVKVQSYIHQLNDGTVYIQLEGVCFSEERLTSDPKKYQKLTLPEDMILMSAEEIKRVEILIREEFWNYVDNLWDAISRGFATQIDDLKKEREN